MKNLSLKNVLWVIGSTVTGYYLGTMAGTLLGFIAWSFIGLVFGGLVYYSNGTIIVNAVLSIAFGILFSLLVGVLDRMLFGSRMSLAIWMGVGAAVGAIVMFAYGINFITHPEHYSGYQYWFPGSARFEIGNDPKQSPSLALMLRTSFGTGTGHFIGLYIGLFAGLLIAIREILGRKQKSEDKKEFDEYARFLKERLKK